MERYDEYQLDIVYRPEWHIDVLPQLKLFFLVLSLSTVAFSQDALDSECRVQAKEAAVTTYQSCVKEARSVKIDEIRKEYQEKLTELKSHYDSELKKLAPSKRHALTVA